MTKNETKQGYRSISRRILLSLLLMALAPLLALGFFCVDRIGAVYDEKESAGLEAISVSKQHALDTFLAERMAQVKNLAFTHSYQELQDVGRLSQIFSIMKSNSSSFVDLGVIGMDGRHVSYAGPFNLKDANYAESLWFTEVMRKNIYVSDVFLGFRHVPHIIIAVLRNEAGHSYIVRATIDMEAVNALVRREMLGDSFLINGQGILQTASKTNGSIMETAPMPVDRLTHRDSLTFEHRNASGEKMMVVMRRLQTMPWILVVMDSAQGDFKILHNLQLCIVLFMLGGGALTAVGAFWCTRRLMDSLRKSDEEQTKVNTMLLQSSKLAALGKMAAGVAHEVNNPLMLIQENAGWIHDLLEDEDRSTMQNYDEIKSSTEKSRNTCSVPKVLPSACWALADA